MDKLACPIENPAFLLPHSGRMVLIDRVTDYGADYVRVEAQVGADHILLHKGALPCTAGMEIMAQAIGAFAGIRALTAGEAVRLGFLLGTRRLDVFADVIPVGTRLAAAAEVSIQDGGGMGVFDCELRWTDAPDEVRPVLPADGLLMRAALNVYSPNRADAVSESA
ncbi:MAG: thioester dehydrase [Neisseria sp.]|nr:thioester dehydrase [Neisseria sp.]